MAASVGAVGTVDERGSRARRQFAIFVVVGGICAALNLGVGMALRATLPTWVAWPSVPAGVLAGTVLSFVLNRRFTFEVQDAAAGPQAVRFAVTSAVSLALATVVAKGLEWLLRAEPIVPPSSAMGANLVHVGTIGVLFVFNFYAMKLFALRA
jgi:putative flippase GtrA